MPHKATAYFLIGWLRLHGVHRHGIRQCLERFGPAPAAAVLILMNHEVFMSPLRFVSTLTLAWGLLLPLVWAQSLRPGYLFLTSTT